MQKIIKLSSKPYFELGKLSKIVERGLPKILDNFNFIFFLNQSYFNNTIRKNKKSLELFRFPNVRNFLS